MHCARIHMQCAYACGVGEHSSSALSGVLAHPTDTNIVVSWAIVFCTLATPYLIWNNLASITVHRRLTLGFSKPSKNDG